MDFSKLLLDLSKFRHIFLQVVTHGFAKIDTWISFSCYMDFSKLIQGFLQVVTCICQVGTCISCPLPISIKFKDSMPWVCFAFGNACKRKAPFYLSSVFHHNLNLKGSYHKQFSIVQTSYFG